MGVDLALAQRDLTTSARSRISGITAQRSCLTLVTLPVETPATRAMAFRTSRCLAFVKFDGSFQAPTAGRGRRLRSL